MHAAELVALPSFPLFLPSTSLMLTHDIGCWCRANMSPSGKTLSAHGPVLDPSKTGRQLAACRSMTVCPPHVHWMAGAKRPALLAMQCGCSVVLPQPAVPLQNRPHMVVGHRAVDRIAEGGASRPAPQPAPWQVPQLVAAVSLAQAVHCLTLQMSQELRPITA